jgi:hypothetical protein
VSYLLNIVTLQFFVIMSQLSNLLPNLANADGEGDLGGEVRLAQVQNPTLISPLLFYVPIALTNAPE